MSTAKENYIQVAKEIEAKLKVPVCVIKRNPTAILPMATTGEGYTIFIIAKEESTFETLEKARDIGKWMDVRQTLPVQDFVALGKKNRRVIRNNMGGMGLISPFFFHEEVYGHYAKSFKRTLKKEFGKELEDGFND
jgi:hypothetical protein